MKLKTIALLFIGCMSWAATAPTVPLLGVNTNTSSYTGSSTFTLVDQANVPAGLVVNGLTNTGGYIGPLASTGTGSFKGSLALGLGPANPIASSTFTIGTSGYLTDNGNGNLVIGVTGVALNLVPAGTYIYTSNPFIAPSYDTFGGMTIGASNASSITMGSGSAGVLMSNFLQLDSLTAAGINALTPAAVGQVYQCSNCSTVPVCISTGTARGSFSVITNKGTACS